MLATISMSAVTAVCFALALLCTGMSMHVCQPMRPCPCMLVRACRAQARVVMIIPGPRQVAFDTNILLRTLEACRLAGDTEDTEERVV